MKDTIVISLGGSVINPGKIDKRFLTDFSRLIKVYVKRGKKFIIICGGGKVARDYINALPVDVSEGSKDVIGILPTWLNSQLLAYYLKDITPPIVGIKTFNEVVRAFESHPVVLAGGLLPGIKTDEDAAIFADYYNASKLINITNVDGIYDKDPKKFDDASKLKHLTFNAFYNLIGSASITAGSNAPFTLMAARIAERSKIPIVVVSRNISSIQKAIDGEEIGTTISFEE